MSEPAAIAMRALLGAAMVLSVAGGAAALLSPNLMKRLAAIAVAQIGAMIALATLGAPSQALVAAGAIAFAQIAVGAAILVRLQESYGDTEASEIDAADAADEPEAAP